jgi:hypothetical protein
MTNIPVLTIKSCTINSIGLARVADPHHFNANADPDPAFYFNADQIRLVYFNVDPPLDLDPAPH